MSIVKFQNYSSEEKSDEGCAEASGSGSAGSGYGGKAYVGDSGTKNIFDEIGKWDAIWNFFNESTGLKAMRSV